MNILGTLIVGVLELHIYQTFLNAVLFVAKCHFNAFATKSVPNWARVIFMVSAHTLAKQSVIAFGACF